jgi:hypothetical protein
MLNLVVRKVTARFIYLKNQHRGYLHGRTNYALVDENSKYGNVRMMEHLSKFPLDVITLTSINSKRYDTSDPREFSAN